MLQTFGNGAIAQFVLSKSAFGSFLSVGSGYGIGLMTGAYVAGGVTGAHMNPAVTLGMAMRGKTNWIKVWHNENYNERRTTSCHFSNTVDSVQ